MAGSTFTYLLGSEAATLMFNSKNEDLNAEDVYSRLTTPVFGKGVAYDVPNPVSAPSPIYHTKIPTNTNSHAYPQLLCDGCFLYNAADLSGTEEDAEDRAEHCSF